MLAYLLVRALLKPIQWLCIPSTILHPERFANARGCVVAPTHISHLEPFVLGVLLYGRVCWMTRKEFYRNAAARAFLVVAGTFPVRRRGYARPTLRAGLALLKRGERVGVFPEAGVTRRQYSAMRGGPIKHGAAFLALHGQVPIIPIAVVGTHAMNRVGPWLPFRRAPVCVAIGEPIEPGPLPATPAERRQRRHELSAALCAQYRALYQELLALPGVDDRHDLSPDEPDDPARVAIDPDAAAGQHTRRVTAKPAHANPPAPVSSGASDG